MDNTKIIKTSKVIDKVLKIMTGFMRAGVIVCAIFVILVFAVGEMIVADSTTMELGMLSLNLNQSVVPEFSAIRWGIVAALTAAAVTCGVLGYIFSSVRGVLKPMLDGCPFEEGTADKIKKLGWITLAGGFIIEILKAVGTYVECAAYDLTKLFNNDVVNYVTMNVKLNFNFVVVAVVILLLSHIFRYGENLQRESDETL